MSLSRAEGRAQRKAIARDADRALKAQAKATVKALREAIRTAKAGRAARVAAAREACARSRRLLRQRGKDRAERLRAELREVTRAERTSARQRCDVGKVEAKRAARSDVTAARGKLAEEEKYQRDLRRIEANNRRSRSNAVRATRAERRTESDGEVLANLAPELVPLWRRVGPSIKGSARRSRTEAFLDYAHENPHEVVSAQEDGVDRAIAEMERKMNAAKRVASSGRRRYTAAELAAVPF